jgi:hypothetical protein
MYFRVSCGLEQEFCCSSPLRTAVHDLATFPRPPNLPSESLFPSLCYTGIFK